MYVLFLHPVQSCRNAGQRLSTPLLPLQERILFLEGKVDVMLLDLIQLDLLHKRRIPQGKVIQPVCELWIFLHFCKSKVLPFVFCPLSGKQFFIAGVILQGIIINCPIDWHRQTLAVF